MVDVTVLSLVIILILFALQLFLVKFQFVISLSAYTCLCSFLLNCIKSIFKIDKEETFNIFDKTERFSYLCQLID